MMMAAGEVRLFLALIVLAGLWTALQLYYTPGQESTTELTPAALKQKSVVNTRLRDRPLVFYNRVPKCGSNSMKILLRAIAKNNYFAFHEDRVYVVETFEDDELQIYADLVYRLPTPSIYEKQIYYVDFQRFGFQQPLYINLVRDPLERRVSWYYYIRFGREGQRAIPRNFSQQRMAQTFDECVFNNDWECDAEGKEGFLLTKFFCGHDQICRQPSQMAVERAKENIRRHYAVVGVLEEFSSFLKVLEVVMPQFFRGAHDTWQDLNQRMQPSQMAVEKAKENIRRHYAVVGVLEEFSSFLKVLEVVMPQFFRGAQDTWQDLNQQTNLLGDQRTINRSPPSPRIRKIMRERLKLDYQVYYFIRERFHMQKVQLGIKD
ncbi:HS2ST1 [Branchiostoma lanceolatum]|uniref:HS2ST1 protein n=1 Tax=Branchiostoma lanceolatum TaxID=7740 RepID=A0A8K0A3G9_BRALA|nr:HS2ST1 [Branchiostoma lanceolatum]